MRKRFIRQPAVISARPVHRAGDTLQLRSAMREEPFVLRVHEVFLELEGNKRDPFLEWIQRRFRSVILVTEETAHQTV